MKGGKRTNIWGYRKRGVVRGQTTSYGGREDVKLMACRGREGKKEQK